MSRLSMMIAVTLAALIIGMCSGQQRNPKFDLSNEFIRRTYCGGNQVKSDSESAVVRITASSSGTSLARVRTSLSEKSGRARFVEISNMPQLFSVGDNNRSITFGELFFSTADDQKLNMSRFAQLECLNLSSNALATSFFTLPDDVDTDGDSSVTSNQLVPRLRVLQLSNNLLDILERKHLRAFESAPLELLMLDNNRLTSVRHDAFAGLEQLKYVSLRNNRIKIVHPLTFVATLQLAYLDLAFNRLKAVFRTPNEEQNSTTTSTLSLKNLKYLNLIGNDELTCDCGLLWLYNAKNNLNLDDFRCRVPSSQQLVVFRSMSSQRVLVDNCPQPHVYANTTLLDETSTISLFRDMSKRWFAWNLLHDDVAEIVPTEYARTNDTLYDELDPLTRNKFPVPDKHVFHSWQHDDAIFECSNSPNRSSADPSASTIIWKTQFGYLSFLDRELMEAASSSLKNELDSSSLLPFPNYHSFKIFYKMNKLTKIYKNLTVKIGKKFGTESRSMLYVRENNQLVVTNMRQAMTGPIVCIAVNERSIDTFEYDMRVRNGVSESFIYSLMISALAMVFPSILGLIVCCVCEYKADKNYPMTPPCYPTPMASTPPNFDYFNEWMSNAASYFPDFNIQETLEQVSKRLRKGMEKASVTVKSLGMTSSAYIYSMYEQSSQRWSDIKQYVPTLNVPNLSMPTMRYPAMPKNMPNMGQLANRMRMGMGNMFIHFREFCGTTDMTHTPSIVDLDAETRASNAVGKNYILDELKQQQTKRSNYYRFLSLIKEESRLNGQPFLDEQIIANKLAQANLQQQQQQQSGSASTSASTSSGALPTTNPTNANNFDPNMLPILTGVKFLPAAAENDLDVHSPTSRLGEMDVKRSNVSRNGSESSRNDDDHVDDDDEDDDPDTDTDDKEEVTKSFLKSLKLQQAAAEADEDEINKRTAKIDPNLMIGRLSTSQI